MSEITGVSGDSSHSREWITKTHKSSRHRKARPTEVDNHELATQFHKACLRVFKLFLHYLPVLSTFRINADQTANAKEELGRLYLWGESFGNGGLEKALEQSDEIRDNVLKLLRGIGGTLLRGNIHLTSACNLLGTMALSDRIEILSSSPETRLSTKPSGKQAYRSSESQSHKKTLFAKMCNILMPSSINRNPLSTKILTKWTMNTKTLARNPTKTKRARKNSGLVSSMILKFAFNV